MSNVKYSDEFKLQVVNDYFSTNLGCRVIAKKYNLPSKNYIARWINQLSKKGLISSVPKSINHKGGISTNLVKNKSPYEKHLEKENLYLKAELAYFKELEKLIDNSKKK